MSYQGDAPAFFYLRTVRDRHHIRVHQALHWIG